jgi:hypothetical protein
MLIAPALDIVLSILIPKLITSLLVCVGVLILIEVISVIIKSFCSSPKRTITVKALNINCDRRLNGPIGQAATS